MMLRLRQRLARLPIPVPGLRFALACGVIGLVYHKRNVRLGEIASRLLRVLEYRGYDSTGGAFQDGDRITLLKAPGAPSAVCEKLEMDGRPGSLFCGQVRWATYGAVDELNSQPHVVRCFEHIYGAHNGNISNNARLKEFLLEQGHSVVSDNDGEMLIHLVEHHYHAERGSGRHADLQGAMRAAIVAASRQVEGSYASVVVLPETGTVYAVKSGSSLYLGLGDGEAGEEPGVAENPFIIASSDLTAVLKMTRLVVPLRQGQFVEYSALDHRVYALDEQRHLDEDGRERLFAAGDPIDVPPHFSRLHVGEISLRDGFEYFMEQEIADQVDSARRLVRYFSLGSERLREFREGGGQGRLLISAMERKLLALILAKSPGAMKEACRDLFDDDALWEMFCELPPEVRADDGFYSDASSLLVWAWEHFTDHPRRDLIKLADLYSENDEINELNTKLMSFVEDARATIEAGGQIIAVCSGTSYNAARTGALFFNDICGVKFVPMLPGEYRGQYNHCIDERDMLVTISQSGETKDVIDVVDDVSRRVPSLRHVSLVNNLNSTLAQERADYFLPLRCGPEIAVPATKSFINQLTLLYGMALYLAAAQGGRRNSSRSHSERFRLIRRRKERLEQIPGLLEETLETTGAGVEEAAELLYQYPSLHILATRMWGVAREGALKIREVVLNHAEGIEATEFKHGPNTILGLNTGYGLDQLRSFTNSLAERLAERLRDGGSPLPKDNRWGAVIQRQLRRLFDPEEPEKGGPVESGGLGRDLLASLYRDYPLIYVTGPGKRDIELTVTQINTHKIRGASSVVIGESDEDLRRAALEAPMGNPGYRGIFIELPPSGDLIYTSFSAILVLQRLALAMCLKKKALLDGLGFENHGVHPDSPKNVSKSITVD